VTLLPQCTITGEQLISSPDAGRYAYDWEQRVRSTHFVLSVNAGHAGSTFFSNRRNYAGAAGSVCFDFEARHKFGDESSCSSGGRSSLRDPVDSYASDPLPGARHGCGLMGWWKGVARRTFLDSPGRLSLASQNTTYAAFALGRANTVGSSEEASLKLEWVRAQQDAIVRSCGNVASHQQPYTHWVRCAVDRRGVSCHLCTLASAHLCGAHARWQCFRTTPLSCPSAQPRPEASRESSWT